MHTEVYCIQQMAISLQTIDACSCEQEQASIVAAGHMKESLRLLMQVKSCYFISEIVWYRLSN